MLPAKDGARTALSEADDSLLASLKTLRSELAQKNHVPAYIVFNNVSLDEMAELKPRTMGGISAAFPASAMQSCQIW